MNLLRSIVACPQGPCCCQQACNSSNYEYCTFHHSVRLVQYELRTLHHSLHKGDKRDKVFTSGSARDGDLRGGVIRDLAWSSTRCPASSISRGSAPRPARWQSILLSIYCPWTVISSSLTAPFVISSSPETQFPPGNCPQRLVPRLHPRPGPGADGNADGMVLSCARRGHTPLVKPMGR